MSKPIEFPAEFLNHPAMQHCTVRGCQEKPAYFPKLTFRNGHGHGTVTHPSVGVCPKHTIALEMPNLVHPKIWEDVCRAFQKEGWAPPVYWLTQLAFMPLKSKNVQLPPGTEASGTETVNINLR